MTKPRTPLSLTATSECKGDGGIEDALPSEGGDFRGEGAVEEGVVPVPKLEPRFAVGFGDGADGHVKLGG